MNNYWTGVIIGGLIGAIFSLVAIISYVDRVNNLTAEVKALREEVADHERTTESIAYGKSKTDC